MFAVRWTKPALGELADVWVNADPNLRKAITSAASDLDSRLEREGDAAGESRPEGHRILLISPLGVHFEVQGSIVRVLRVWLFRKPK
jgi:hypothetical protein